MGESLYGIVFKGKQSRKSLLLKKEESKGIDYFALFSQANRDKRTARGFFILIFQNSFLLYSPKDVSITKNKANKPISTVMLIHKGCTKQRLLWICMVAVGY